MFSFKPQQLMQTPSSTQLQAIQPKTSGTNISVVQQPQQASPSVKKITGTAGTILIRAQSPTSAVQKQQQQKPQQLSLIAHPNIKIQEAPQVRKISSEITVKNQSGNSVLFSPPSTVKNQSVVSISQLPSTMTQQKKILLPVSSTPEYQTIVQIPKQKLASTNVAKQAVKIIQSSVKETKQPVPILPKPDPQQILVKQQIILPATSSQQSFVIVQQTPTNSQVKSNVITIPVTGSTFAKNNIQQPQAKWTMSSYPPALTPIQPKITITPQKIPVSVPEKNESVNVVMEINESYSSSESETFEDNSVEEQKIEELSPEKLIESAKEKEEQFTMVKRIIEGENGLQNTNNKPDSDEINNTENVSTEVKQNNNNNNSILLCDEEISSVTPEESPETSDKSKEQVTPTHVSDDMLNKNQSIEDIKRNLKLDLISNVNPARDEIRMEVDENDSVISDDQSTQSSVTDLKKITDEALVKNDEATTSKIDQNKNKRNRKPKNPTVNTSMGLPYKPPQPSSRKKKVEKKVELEMDFHDPLNKILWEDGIGGLNNCNKLFGFNEFGLIEVLGKKDATAKLKPYEPPAPDDNGNFKFRKIVEPKDQFVCFVCSKYGTVRDFFSPECCSESCFAITKRKTTDISSTSKDENIDSGLNTPTDVKKVMFDGEMVPLQEVQMVLLEQHLPKSKRSNRGSQRMISFGVPEAKFTWDSYLTSKSIPAPESLFEYTAKTASTDFRVGMKLEAIDPRNQHMICVCTIEEKLGCRMKLHFDGYPASHDFWTSSDSYNIFPTGFCQSSGRKLNVPPKWNNKKFDWTEYFDHTNSIGAQRYMFPRLNASVNEKNPLVAGMKLEVKHEDNWYAATIIDIINTRLLIRFDGANEILGCYWFTIGSPYISYCGSAKESGEPFLSPDGNESEDFNWTEYLKDTQSEQVPKDFMVQNARQPYQFEPGMKLEVVDKVNPQLIRPATILNQSGYKIQVIFDGFDINYAYWLDDDSEDIHPINYCKLTEHPIEHPAGVSKLSENALCSMNGCRGIGNGIYADRYFHDSSDECPYNVNNFSRLLEVRDNTRLDYKPYIRR